MRWLAHVRTLLAAAAFATPVSFAGTASGIFSVQINLNAGRYGDICISSALSQQTNAVVRVACAGGQFVSIEPRPGSAFVGTHGGAWRFVFQRNTPIPAFLMGDGESAANIGTGTITAMRLLDVQQRDETLELLVSF